MKRMICIIGLFLVSVLIGYAAANVGERQTSAAPAVEHRTQKEIYATIKKLMGERQVSTVLIGAQTDNYYLMVVQRSEQGEAEKHANFDDLFIVRRGTAEVIVGGEKVSPKEATPGEWRARSIKGGRPIKLAAGDTLRIPCGTPHQTIPHGQF